MGNFSHPLPVNLMIATLLFSAVAAGLVFLIGRRDPAQDPRLTVIALMLAGIFPVLVVLLPKFAVFPTAVLTGNLTGFTWQTMVMAGWVFIVLLGFSRLLLAARGLVGWRRRSELLEVLDGVEIRCLAEIKSPVAAGVFRPVIFVPADWEAWPEGTRQIVLNHEMAHHRRRDPLWRLVGELACVVNAYNPWVVWMTRRLAAQCEYACDARVLEKGVAAGDYARVLCDFAASGNNRGLVLAMAETSSLEARVRRLLDPKRPLGAVALATGITVAILSAAALAMVGPAAHRDLGFSQKEVDLRWSANPFPQ